MGSGSRYRVKAVTVAVLALSLAGTAVVAVVFAGTETLYLSALTIVLISIPVGDRPVTRRRLRSAHLRVIDELAKSGPAAR
jgi:hypothetical protein